MSEIVMKNDDFQNYGVWDMKLPDVSRRSIFYNLPPVGIGTAEVESLSGYISRLAQEHYLSPVVLLKNSVADLSELPRSLLQNSISAVFAGSLNGFGSNTKAIVRILEKATFRSDIHRTSLLPFKDKLSNHKLLKKQLAWCPVCYVEQKEERETVYDKLLWSIEKVRACDIHRIPLEQTCPHCCKNLKVLSSKSRPGYCSKCLGWLGSNAVRLDALKRFDSDEEKKIEIWRAARIGEFLTGNSPFFMPENQPVFMRNLNVLIRRYDNGNINDFAYRTGIWHVSVRRLAKGEVLPTMEMILNICFPLGIRVIELFEEGNIPATEAKPQSANAAKHSTKPDISNLLIAFSSEFPPPSANEVARRTGWTTTRLQRHFSEEYKLIVERYTRSIREKLSRLTDEEVKQVMLRTTKENPPPSLQSVFRRVGCRNTGYRYYRKFPGLCAKITKRYEGANSKKFDVEKAGKVMKAALKELPPPSYSEIAGRLKCTRDNLNKKMPELSKLLHARYASYIKTEKNTNRQELYNAVKQAILQLREVGHSITENQVKKNLPRKWNDQSFKKTYRMVVNEFNLEIEK